MSAHEFTYEMCNDIKFKWINKSVNEYPQESSRQQYTRSCYLSCETYLLENEINALIDFLNQHGLKSWVYIKHDDNPPDEHYHMLLYFEKSISCLKLLHMVNNCQLVYNNDNYRNTTFITMRIRQLSNMIQYLRHESQTSTDKKQYDWCDCTSNDLDYWKTLSSAPTMSGNVGNLFYDMDKLTYRELAIKYGRDFVINFKAYNYYYDLIKKEEERRTKL